MRKYEEGALDDDAQAADLSRDTESLHETLNVEVSVSSGPRNQITEPNHKSPQDRNVCGLLAFGGPAPVIGCDLPKVVVYKKYKYVDNDVF